MSNIPLINFSTTEDELHAFYRREDGGRGAEETRFSDLNTAFTYATSLVKASQQDPSNLNLDISRIHRLWLSFLELLAPYFAPAGREYVREVRAKLDARFVDYVPSSHQQYRSESDDPLNSALERSGPQCIAEALKLLKEKHPELHKYLTAHCDAIVMLDVLNLCQPSQSNEENVRLMKESIWTLQKKNL